MPDLLDPSIRPLPTNMESWHLGDRVEGFTASAKFIGSIYAFMSTTELIVVLLDEDSQFYNKAETIYVRFLVVHIENLTSWAQ